MFVHDVHQSGYSGTTAVSLTVDVRDAVKARNPTSMSPT